MNHPEITRQNANERYARMLQTASDYRKAKKVSRRQTQPRRLIEAPRSTRKAINTPA
ncbi:MAG: hypothetical protein GY796_08060 [Chloroflexi bacterium]|nr:hypothetical protein [Chloroflexota bacterium]